MKIDLTQVPPNADDIEVERAYLALKKEQLKKKLRLTGFLHTVIVILGVVVGGYMTSMFESSIFPATSFLNLFVPIIHILIFMLIFISFVFFSSQFITEPVNKLEDKLDKGINKLSKMIPSAHLEKLEEITKISTKNPVVKQYIQAALSRRDFLIKAEYSAIKSCDDTRQGQLRKEERDKKEQRIYAALKGEAS